MSRVALFKCTRSGKVVYCFEGDNYLEFGSGYPDQTDLIDWLEKQGNIREIPFEKSYFDNFVNTYSRTMVRLK